MNKDKTDELIDGEKTEQYGSGVQNMIDLAEVWNWYLTRIGNRKLTAPDVCNMNVLAKIGREGGKHKKDMENYTDGHGYFRLAERYYKEKAQKEEDDKDKI